MSKDSFRLLNITQIKLVSHNKEILDFNFTKFNQTILVIILIVFTFKQINFYY